MKYIRVAGLFTVSGLMALLLATLFGQATTSSPSIAQPAAANQTPSSATATAQDATVNALGSPDLDTVRALCQAGLTDAAMSELRRWVQKNPKAAIPIDIKDFLASLDDNALDVARANRDAGLLDEARASLKSWIQQHPKKSVPKDLAALLPGPIDNSLQLARAYKKTNSLEAAAAELQKWIQRHPESPVPADLEDLLPRRFDALLWTVRHSLGPWISPALKILGGLVLLVLVLLRWTPFCRPFLVIGDFESVGSDATLGKRIAALVRQQLAEPRSARSSLTIASGPVDPIQIPAEITSGLSSALPMAQTITALFRWVSPRRVITITGLLHPQGLRGAGITLTIAENQSASRSVTLWQQSFEPDFAPVPVGTDTVVAAQTYDFLVAPSATWVQFHMQEGYGSRKEFSFQTRDWHSQANFDAGLRLTDLGRQQAAQVMYRRALARDPNNLAARLNLALFLPSSQISEPAKTGDQPESSESPKTGDQTGISDPAKAGDQPTITGPAKTGDQPGTLWRRAWHGVLSINSRCRRWLKSDPAKTDDQTGISDPAKTGEQTGVSKPTEVSEQIKQLEYVVAETKKRSDDSTYYPAAFSLAMALVDAGDNERAKTVAQELDEKVTKGLAKIKSTDNSAHDNYLRIIAPSAHAIAAALASSPLPEGVDQLWPSTEFQYNLACYYSMLGKDLISSIEHLEFAAFLDPSKVAAQAKKDTALRNVRESPETASRFAKIVTLPGAPVAPAPSVLASLIVIGPERAAVLLSNAVVSPADLIVKCTTLAGASAVAAAVGVKLDTILRWARVAELTRLPNIQPSHINALTLGGLDSLAALRGVMPNKFGAVLQDWGSDAPTLSADTIGAWALEIMNTTSVVFQTQN